MRSTTKAVEASRVLGNGTRPFLERPRRGRERRGDGCQVGLDDLVGDRREDVEPVRQAGAAELEQPSGRARRVMWR